jgi:dihydroneopterin aldolase
MTIHIQSLQIETIIGILKHERTQKQKIILDCTIDYEKGFIDYAKVVEFFQKTIQEKEFGLIEDALDFLGKNLFINYPNIKNMEIKIVKPEILKGCKVGVSKKFNFS